MTYKDKQLWFVVLTKSTGDNGGSISIKRGKELTQEDFNKGIVNGAFSTKKQAEAWEDESFIDSSIL